jgi:hypothetical protein
VATRRHARQHAFDDEASKEVLGREHRPGVELDLLALARAATRSAHGDLAAAEDDRAGRRAVPVGAAARDLRVLGADALGELGLHHLRHHDEPGGRRERQQPVFHRRSDLSERHGRLEAEPNKASRLLGMVGDGHDRYLLHQVVPFLIGVFVDARNPAMSRASGGGPPPHFNRTGDNLFVPSVPGCDRR